MRKASRKIASSFLAAAMLIPSFSLPAAASEPDTGAASAEYKIYPTPQSVVYGTGATTVSKDVHVVYSAGIDQFTKDHAKEVFALLGQDVTLSEGDTPEEGKTNLLVGIQGEESPAADYFETHTIAAKDLFEKTDSYALEIGEGTIAILGVSTDAAFYGLTSLKHIFSQVENREVRSLRIEDFADVKTRGFIEGYYGNPWSHEDRLDLMKFGGDYKLNGYFYAPKDDPKHNAKWRELYTEDELQKHKELAEAGNKSKCYYIYALHPFMHNAVNFGDNYARDLKIIEDKFEQLMQVGVKQFAILADDAAVPGGNPQNYVTLMTDLTEWIKTKQSEYPGLKSDMIFCPADYMGNGSSAEMQTLKQLPDSVSIVQTGGRIWGEVGPSFNDPFYERMGRPAFMWINWPCSDNTKDGLIMGGAEAVLKPNTNPNTVNGIVLNPMQQSEPSKQGLFTNADYAWNIWSDADHYTQVWNDSFAYIDHGTGKETAGSNAYRELSKHMKNSKQIGNSESEELSPKLDAFKAKLTGNQTITDEDIAEIRAEFEKLRDAARTYREETGNKRTLSQIIYWIDAWDDTTSAVLGYLDALSALNHGESTAAVWDHFASAQNAKTQAGTHGFHYVDHTEYAKAGRIHITPFMNALDSALSARILPLIDPNLDTATFITSRSDTPEGSLDNVFDGNASTQIVFKTPSTLSAGDYVGVIYTQPKDIYEIQFLLGQSGNLNDTFSKAKVQITADGKTWTDLNDTVYTTPQEIYLSDLDLKGVRGVRVLSTEDKTNTWLGVRDIRINPEQGGSSEIELPSSTFTLGDGCAYYQQSTADQMTDGDTSTFAWISTPGDYAPVGPIVTRTFSEAVQLNEIVFVNGGAKNDKLTHFALEYSEDGTTWKTAGEYTDPKPESAQSTFRVKLHGASVKAIRINNLESVHKWLQIAEFNVVPGDGSDYDTEHLITNADSTSAVTSEIENGRQLLTSDGQNLVLKAGEYAGVDLGEITKIASLTHGDLGSLSLEVSRNGYEWVSVAADASSAEDARYVRLINTTDASVSADLSTPLSVTVTKISGPYRLSDTVGITSAGWASEDTRDNGAAFDGDVDTTTEFATLPAKGSEIIYDLGQNRSISKLEIVNQDSAVNYIRDAKIQISSDLENWTDVMEIGDGVENTDDADVTAKDADAGYMASSRYPNKVTKVGTLETAQDARYIRIYFTAGNASRAVLFNEILINDGEYKSVPHPAVTAAVEEAQNHSALNMFDSDLSTSYKPASSQAGSVQYDFSDELDANTLNIIQKGTLSNATVSVRAVNTDGKIEWKTLGHLVRSLNTMGSNDIDKILSVKIEWTDGNAPEISEIIRFTSENPTVQNLDYSQLLLAWNKATAQQSSFVNGSDLEEAITQAHEVINAASASQNEINEAARALNSALLTMRIAPEADRLNGLK